jgi:hypothetical protein
VQVREALEELATPVTSSTSTPLPRPPDDAAPPDPPPPAHLPAPSPPERAAPSADDALRTPTARTPLLHNSTPQHAPPR